MRCTSQRARDEWTSALGSGFTGVLNKIGESFSARDAHNDGWPRLTSHITERVQSVPRRYNANRRITHRVLPIPFTMHPVLPITATSKPHHPPSYSSPVLHLSFCVALHTLIQRRATTMRSSSRSRCRCYWLPLKASKLLYTMPCSREAAFRR